MDKLKIKVNGEFKQVPVSALKNDLNFVSDENYVHTDNNYTKKEKEKLDSVEANANNYVLPNDVVRDSNYIHTDNNYTDKDKSKLDSLENITVDAKNIPFEDNYGYGTPDNIHDALDYAFEELDNRAFSDDLNSYVSYSHNQNKNENQKNMARNNIGALGITYLGEVNLYDDYDGDIRNFLDTITSTGLYTFFDTGDEFYWFVEVYKLDNGSIGQVYWGQEEGYGFKNYRSGFYDENSKTFDVFDEWQYLTLSQAEGMFSSKNHDHVLTISTSKDIRDYLNTYTNYANKDLRITSSINKHVYIVKLEFTSYSTTDGMRYVRYQEYYDIEESNKIYKRMGTSKTASISSIIWEDWYVFEGVSE